MNWNKILAEHAKCLLLCSNCHREIEAEARGDWKAPAENVSNLRKRVLCDETLGRGFDPRCALDE